MTENRSNNATKTNSKHPFPTSEATREEELDPPSEIGLAVREKSSSYSQHRQ